MKIIAWWDNLTMPNHLPNVTPIQRAIVRRAHIINRFALIILIASLLSSPSSLMNRHHMLTVNLIFVLLLQIAALILNRRGWAILAGVCCLIGIIIGIVSPLIIEKLGVLELPILCIFAIPTFLAGVLLPPIMVFVCAAVDSLIICLIILFLPHTLELQTLLNKTGPISYMVPPLSLQFIIAIVTFILVRNLLQEIERADNAEEVTKLQSMIVSQKQAEAEERQRLEESIHTIAHVHAEIARGNLDVRVPLTQNNVLWQVAVPLNNLLNRVNKWKNESERLEKLQHVIVQSTQILQEARLHGEVPLLQRSETTLDPLLAEIHHLSRKGTQSLHDRQAR